MFSNAPWMAEAWRGFGIAERAGAAADPRIVAYYRDAGHPEITSDEVAWCAAFLGAALARTGFAATGSLLARSYSDYGQELDDPDYGAIAVFPRGGDPQQGHVGFVAGATETHLYILGGNQSDAVTVAAFPRANVIALRWPQPKSQTPEILFDRCLAHVLKMEGGFTDDPYDPGGPTNFGITLATLAAHKRIPLDAASRDALLAELKAIPRNLVRDIYLARYWMPSRAPELPPALALMHFDASVNHGVTGAAKLLQHALDVTIDGEIGPETLGAARSTNIDQILAAYAEARRDRYRSLPHVWRFGRGWLARVDKTLTAALTLAKSTKETPMTTTQSNTPKTKWWGESLTIWGAIITTLSTVLPTLGPLIGLDITAEMVRDLGEALTQTVQAIGGLIGVVMTIYGRVRATTVLTLHEAPRRS